MEGGEDELQCLIFEVSVLGRSDMSLMMKMV